MATVLVLRTQAQPINRWTNPASASWQSMSWSLGILPASEQTVNVTNGGYKAVAVDSATFSAFPDSVTISNLTVSAPTNALSTVLLNYAGTAAPLKVLDQCVIATNGALDNFDSSFEVDCTNGGQLLLDGGTFVQQNGLTVVNGPVSVLNNGSITTSNANLTLGRVTIGSAPASVGTFIQNGGSIAAQQVNVSAYHQDPFAPGGYELSSGILYAIEGTQCSAQGAGFRQFGGTNYGNITVMDGYYELRSGMVQGNVLTVANDAGFAQEGGLLDMQFINVTGTSNWPASGGPDLAAGIVHCGTLNIGGNGKVGLTGADVFVTNNFDLHGEFFMVGDVGPLIEHADCQLSAGRLSLPSMTLGQYASFDQMGGSNEIRGGLTMNEGQYNLYGGTLETIGTGVGAAATFAQSGGQHLVQGVLSITGSYDLNGASPGGGVNLVCQGLYLRGALTMTLYFNGRYIDPAPAFTNTGVLNLGGTLTTQLPDAEAGQLQLATNAVIAFAPGYPAVLRFLNSSSISWTTGALLVITNWSNSDHVFAGTDASGLSPSQLQQVQFANPAGFAPGAYSARILPTGEIVPIDRPTIAPARTSNGLVLTWSGNSQLLSATNVAGPYFPVPGAGSPWTNFFSRPRQFFRLQ